MNQLSVMKIHIVYCKQVRIKIKIKKVENTNKKYSYLYFV